MLRTVFWFIYFWLYQIKIYPNYLKLKKLQSSAIESGDQEKIDEAYKAVYVESKKWARNLVEITGSKVTVIGEANLPKNDTVLFVSNHQGNFDIPLTLAYIDMPKGYISKEEIRKLPFVGKWMELMKCVFIDRNDKRKSIRALGEAADNIGNGYSLVLFPEGTRSKSNELGPFKASLSKLIKKADVKIIPVTIDGSYKIMEANGMKIKSAHVTITIGKPFDTKDLTKQEIDSLIEEIKNIIQSNLQHKL